MNVLVTGWRGPSKWLLASLIAIVGVGLVTYWNALHIGFWTDDYWLVDNAGRLDLASYLQSYFDPWVQWRFYRPMQGIFWWIAYALFHSDPVGYHAMQLGLHILNAILLFDLVSHVSRRWRIGLVAALVALTLPLPTLAVFWVGVADPLVAFFYLLTLRLWIVYLERERFVWFVLAVMAYVLALLCKEIAVTLPAALFLADCWLVRRPFRLAKSIKRYAPLLLLVIIYGWIEWNINTHGVFTTSLGYGLGGHIFIALLHHLSSLALPWVGESNLTYGWLLILSVGVLIAIFKREWRIVFLPAVMILTMLPVLPFQLNMATAARYLYLPLMGSAVGVALIAAAARANPSHWVAWIISIAMAILVVWQSTLVAVDAQAFEGTVRQTRLQFRSIFQTYAAFPPDTLLYFIDPPLDSSYISGLFFLRYGKNTIIDGSDRGYLASWHDHKSTRVFYQDDDKNWRSQAAEPNVNIDSVPNLPVHFGPSISLAGFEIARTHINRSDPAVLLLYWKTLEQIPRDYSVFVHLVDKDGQIIAGADQLLLKGDAPTSRWRVNDPVTQGIIIPIDPAVAPGDYQIQIGVYYLPTLERLPVTDNRDLPETDQIVIQPITIQ